MTYTSVPFVAYGSLRTHRLRCVAWVAFVAYRSQRTHRLRCIRCVGCVCFVTFSSLRTHRLRCVACVGCIRIVTYRADPFRCVRLRLSTTPARSVKDCQKKLNFANSLTLSSLTLGVKVFKVADHLPPTHPPTPPLRHPPPPPPPQGGVRAFELTVLKTLRWLVCQTVCVWFARNALRIRHTTLCISDTRFVCSVCNERNACNATQPMCSDLYESMLQV